MKQLIYQKSPAFLLNIMYAKRSSYVNVCWFRLKKRRNRGQIRNCSSLEPEAINLVSGMFFWMQQVKL